jgi:hypothetical protein
MTIDELKQKACEMFKITEQYKPAVEKWIDQLYLNYNIDDLYQSMAVFTSINKRGNFFKDYYPEVNKWVEKIVNKIKYVSEIKDIKVVIIMNTIISAIEYRVQEFLGNTEITDYTNRSNYRRITKEKMQKLNDAMKSFELYEDGEVKIIASVDELISNLVNSCSWLNVGDFTFKWIIKNKIENILSIIFSDLFYIDDKYWYEDLTELLKNFDLINKLLNNKYNDVSKYTMTVNDTVFKIKDKIFVEGLK